MSRTLDEIEAVLDVLVPNLAAAVETSKGLLNALGGTVGDIYQESMLALLLLVHELLSAPETLRLKLDYDSDEEKEKELRSDRNKSKRRSAKWKQDIVLNRKVNQFFV